MVRFILPFTSPCPRPRNLNLNLNRPHSSPFTPLAGFPLPTLILSLAANLSATELPDYKIGDTAKDDIFVPTQLVVIDPDETVALKQKEALRVPVICRYYTNAVDEVENNFRLTFANTRSNFLQALEAAFNRPKLGTQAVASPKFHRITMSFQRQNKSFPLSTNLATVWALGESDRVLQSSLAATLRESMSRPLRLARLPPELKLGYTVRLVPLADWDEPLSLEQAEQRGWNTRQTNIITLGKARDELLKSFALDDLALAKFLNTFLKSNCVPDPVLTLQSRAKNTDAIYAADRYEPGQLLVQRGQIIDKKIKLALDQLREKTAIGDLQQQVNRHQWSARQADLRNRWIAAGVGALVLVLSGAVWVLARRRRPTSLLPVLLQSDRSVVTVECPSCSEPVPVPIQNGPEDLRARLAPLLARLMMTKLMQRIISQRSALLQTQQLALSEMTELEQRLDKVHAPLQDRLRAYEQRISDLEKELARKGEENRELIKAKIQMARKQLTATKERLELN